LTENSPDLSVGGTLRAWYVSIIPGLLPYWSRHKRRNCSHTIIWYKK